jgi:hypothetical protein
VAQPIAAKGTDSAFYKELPLRLKPLRLVMCGRKRGDSKAGALVAATPLPRSIIRSA